MRRVRWRGIPICIQATRPSFEPMAEVEKPRGENPAWTAWLQVAETGKDRFRPIAFGDSFIECLKRAKLKGHGEDDLVIRPFGMGPTNTELGNNGAERNGHNPLRKPK